jgi:hypothetical protein
MAGENKFSVTTIKAGADYRSVGLYHAFAVVDGQLAANAEEASGILLSKPYTNEFATIGYHGEMKFAAGGAIAKGGKITVTTSGWFTAAGSEDTVVGEAKLAVTSGSIGTGFFQFASVVDRTNFFVKEVTPASVFIAGTAYCLGDNLQADNGREAAGVAPSALTSGTAGDVVVFGIVNVRMDPAKVSSAGDVLTVATSGYFTVADSGYYGCARALTNIGSASLGAALFYGTAGYESV